MNGNLSDVMQLVPSESRRRFQSVGAGLVPIQVDNKTFMFTLPDGMDASQFEYQIIQPENVRDQMGNLPAFTRKVVVVAVEKSYSTSTVDTQGIITFAKVIAAICWLTLFFDSEVYSFLQILFLHYFVSSTFPQTFSQILSGMKIATLSWLPNVLSGVVPEVARSSVIPPKIID